MTSGYVDTKDGTAHFDRLAALVRAGDERLLLVAQALLCVDLDEKFRAMVGGVQPNAAEVGWCAR